MAMGAEFQTSHLPVGPTYFFRIEGTPTEQHPQFDEGAGVIRSAEAAEEIACRSVSESHWRIDWITGPEIHVVEDYDDDPDNLEFFEQAQLDGEVYVFNMYDEHD